MFTTLYKKLGIDQELGLKLWAEITIHLLQHCVCNNGCNCLKEDKCLDLVLSSWIQKMPDRQRTYCIYLIGKYQDGRPTLKILSKLCNLDLSLGHEYNMTQLINKSMEIEGELLKVVQAKYN